MKTIEQIRERYNNEDRRRSVFIDFGGEVLGQYLPEYWKDEAREEMLKAPPLEEAAVREEAMNYLRFAFDKALDHRGISASRSVLKMREYAWILDLDEAAAFADDGANYPKYGVPVLKKMAQVLGVEMPEAIAVWPDGLSCTPGCQEGCGA